MLLSLAVPCSCEKSYRRVSANFNTLLLIESSRVAEDQGYLVMALDWRGMSSFDMPVIIKSLLASPKALHATRDNLIQGYVCKLVLQHFAQSGPLLQQDWLQFTPSTNSNSGKHYETKKYNQRWL